jgi:hypothetical protein
MTFGENLTYTKLPVIIIINKKKKNLKLLKINFFIKISLILLLKRKYQNMYENKKNCVIIYT